MKTVVCGGLKFLIREGTTDEKVIPEVVKRRVYFQRGFLEVETGEKWLDLGANIGAFSALAAYLGARVVAYEPEPENFEIMRRNMEFNNFSFEPICKAVNLAGAPGLLYVCSSEKNKYRHTLKAIRGRESIEIDCESFDEAINTHNPDGLKMDIEGAEINILDGAENIQRLKKLAFEYHFDHDYSVDNFRRRMARLESMGFVVSYSRIPDSVREYRFFPASKIIKAIKPQL